MEKQKAPRGLWEEGKGGKRPLFSVSPSHRASRVLSFSFPPASPLRQKEAFAEERGENQQKNTSSEQEWKVVMTDGVYIWDQNLEYFGKKSRSISFSLGYNFVRSQLRFWRFVKPNLFSNSEDHISLSCSPRPLGMGLRKQSDPDVGNLGRGENEAADSYGRPFPASDPVGVEEGTLLEYPSRHYNSFSE